MKKNFSLAAGIILLALGVFGSIWREYFGAVPLYHLILDIALGIWGVVFGLSRE